MTSTYTYPGEGYAYCTTLLPLHISAVSVHQQRGCPAGDDPALLEGDADQMTCGLPSNIAYRPPRLPSDEVVAEVGRLLHDVPLLRTLFADAYPYDPEPKITGPYTLSYFVSLPYALAPDPPIPGFLGTLSCPYHGHIASSASRPPEYATSS